MNDDLSKIAFLIKDKLIKKLEYLEDVDDAELQEMISLELKEASKEEYLTVKDRIQLGKIIFHSMRKLGILEEFIADEEITEIMVNGPNHIFYEKKGKLRESERHFESSETLESVIQQIVAKCNRVVNESSPIVDARLENGSRVNVVLNPVAINGPILTIRRFPTNPLLIKDLIKINSLTEEADIFLKKLVISRYNIIISGGTGSGKTTFLNALSAYIPQDERIITIEDSAELQIQGVSNLVRLETKNANTDSTKPITIRDLIKSSLRMRPDRIIVGECRGGEAMDMICSAMNCGHDGSMSTVHANSAFDTLARLETMILMAIELPISAIRRQIAGGVDIIVHLGRLRDKSRKVLEIVELRNFSSGEIECNKLFEFEEKGEIDGKIIGSLVKKGDLINDTKLKAAGIA